MAVKITKKKLIKEIIRCGRDPVYFLKTYARIQHPVLGLIPFNTYDYQDDLINAFIENRMNIVLKARQLGVTTVTAGYIAWLILFHRDKNVLVVATKQKVAKNTIRTIKNIYKYLPKWMTDMGRRDVDNRFSIELSNGSRVEAVTTTKDVGRSEAVSLLIVDEAAHIEGMDEIWTGIGPTVSTGGSVMVFSTPKGTGNWFHKTFQQAKAGENKFNCTFGNYVNPQDPNESYNDRLMWWVHPDRDQTWFNEETAGDDPRKIAQERLCCFNASGDTFIWHEDIARLEEQVRNPSRVFNLDRNIWIWDEPVPGGRYLISSDISSGVARDYSTFHVLRYDMQPLEQVAEYRGKVKPDQLGVLLIAVSRFYNGAIIAPENNSGWSGQTIQKIQESGCGNSLYYSRKRQRKYKDDYYTPDPYYAERRNDFAAGYTVSHSNRSPMLAKMEQYIRMQDIVINSVRLVDELKTFIMTPSNRPEAQRGCYDDLVMALAGGLWVRDEAFLHTYNTDEVTDAMLGAMSLSSGDTRQYSDFGYEGDFFDRGRIREHVEQQNKMVMGNGDVVDLSWLLSDKSAISKG